MGARPRASSAAYSRPPWAYPQHIAAVIGDVADSTAQAGDHSGARAGGCAGCGSGSGVVRGAGCGSRGGSGSGVVRCAAVTLTPLGGAALRRHSTAGMSGSSSNSAGSAPRRHSSAAAGSGGGGGRVQVETASSPTDYAYVLQVQTRWKDNDVFGHVNNAVYYALMDTVINEYLLSRGVLQLPTLGGAAPSDGDHPVGFCVDSACQFLAPLKYPEPVDACLRVAHVGKTSARYEVGLFRAASRDAPARCAAVGHFVHVFVDPRDQRPVALPSALRDALTRLIVKPSAQHATAAAKL